MYLSAFALSFKLFLMDEGTFGNEGSESEGICIGYSKSNGRPNNLAYTQGWKCFGLGHTYVGLESNAEKMNRLEKCE